MMFLEPIHGVTVCVGMADYLELALSHNRRLFSECVVATSVEDEETQQVAGRHNCTAVAVENVRTSDGVFAKGALVERALQQLPGHGWRCHFDADICFPGNMRTRLGPALYDRQAVYGCDRMNVVGPENYQKLLDSGWAIRGWESQHFLLYSTNRAEIGSRLIYGDQGWVPIGFFQLWHAEAETKGIYRIRSYPTGSQSAAHDDVQFSLRFDRHKRIFIPEILVAHLVTPDMKHGANWKGRTTSPFKTVNRVMAAVATGLPPQDEYSAGAGR